MLIQKNKITTILMNNVSTKKHNQHGRMVTTNTKYIFFTEKKTTIIKSKLPPPLN